MTGRQHGGARTPNHPAAVSGPGALSQRTDGGAGNAKQPIRVPSGGKYGERQAAEQQQASAPMASSGPLTSAPTGTGGGNLAPPPVAGGAFGPTQRPNEANTAGAGQQMNPVAQNPQAFLRVLYSQFPHPAIERLVDWSSTKGNTQQ